MKNPIRNLVALGGLAAAVTAVGMMSLPASTAAFTTIGGSLSTGQRDFRVFNNFADSQANNNTIAHANFPGQVGAVMSIWKGHVEWASVPVAGNGLGDGVGSNLVLGDGGANFDNTFQGLHTAPGGQNANIHSAETGGFCGGSTLAYTLTPISDGWTIRYCEAWTWHDGPGSVSGIDIQGVACHEIGHSLGLGHSGTSSATMFFAISGSGAGQRSLHSDDIAGVQFVYGVKSGSKPEITGLSGSFDVGGILTITGQNFSTSGNQVWFTQPGGGGIAKKVTGVSSTGGGTVINVTIPTGADDGDVLVQKNATGHTSLSNAWPIDVGGVAGGLPSIAGVDPILVWYGGWQEVTITGLNFSGTTDVDFGASPALAFATDSDSQITATVPPGTFFTAADVTVTNGNGADTLVNGIFYTSNPSVGIDTVNPSVGPPSGGTTVTVSGASVVGVTEVRFGGVAGTSLQITSATTLSVDTPATPESTVDVEAIGDTSDILVGGFLFADLGSFVNLGPSGAPGVLGEPVFTGSGDLSPGGAGFVLTTTGILPLAAGALYVSLTEGAVPFKGGIFYAHPILVSIPMSASLGGGITLPGLIDASIPGGTSIVLQQWFSDATAPKGASGTNGLRLDVP